MAHFLRLVYLLDPVPHIISHQNRSLSQAFSPHEKSSKA